jgi:quinol monooxygenase YgiN
MLSDAKLTMKITLIAVALLFCGTCGVRAEEEHPFAKAIAAKLTNPAKKFTLIIRATVKEGQAEKFIAAFAEAIEPTRKESGCSRYELSQINGEANSFVVYERWANLEKMKAHLATPHTKKLLETIMPLVDGEPEIVVLTPKAEPKKPAKPAADAAEKKPEAK